MRYIVSLNNVTRSDSDKLGFRAADLGILKEKGFNVPLTFTINSEAFEDFMAHNGLRLKIDRLVKDKGQDAYPEIQSLFLKGALPQDMAEEILEAYESLSIEPGASASSLIADYDSPIVTVLRSPTYILSSDDEEGIFQNVKGKEQVLEAIKLSWATMFSPESHEYRRGSAIAQVLTGIVVQKMKKFKSSSQTKSRTDTDDQTIEVLTYKGLPDYGYNILGKDLFLVDLNSLMVKHTQVNVQEYEVVQDLGTEQLVKRPLLENAARQKLNDKIVSECARITKRSRSFIGKDVKLYLGVIDEFVYVLQANRLTFHPKTKIIERAETILAIEGQAKAVSEEHEFRVEQTEQSDDKLVLPGIMSPEEAKELVEKTEPEKVFSMAGFEEKISEQQVEHETELLEHVLELKALIDRMEQHASSGDKQSYCLEAEKLQRALDKLRSS